MMLMLVNRSIRCMLFLISVTKCPVAILVNFIITSGEKYGQVKVIKCLPNYNPWRDINSDPSPNIKIQTLTLNDEVAYA